MLRPHAIIDKIILTLDGSKDPRHGIQGLTNALLLDQKSTTMPDLVDSSAKIYKGVLLLEKLVGTDGADVPHLFTAIMTFALTADIRKSKNTAKFFINRIKILEEKHNLNRKDN